MQVVTGATGFVGNALVRALLAQDVPGVVALVGPSRRTESLAGLEVKTLEADMRSFDSLLCAFQGAEVVYHTAGLVSIRTGGLRRLLAANVEGTRNVLRACRAAKVGRLIYTSSVHALLEPPVGACLDETVPVDPAGVRGPYAQSKAEATRLVLSAAWEGLDTVVVFPSGIIGPYDFRPSYAGRFILDCAQGRLKAYVDGAYNFVDVRDVAKGLISAAGKGRTGQGYILAGHKVSVADLIRAIEHLTGVPGPRWRIPFRLARAAGTLMPAYYWASRRQPLFTTYSLDVIASNCTMISCKAQRELGFCPRPLQETLKDTIDWLKEAGKICT